MKPNLRFSGINLRVPMLVLALILSSLACNLSQPKASPSQVPTVVELEPTRTSEKMSEPTREQEPIAPINNPGELIRQWASAGEATSEFGSVDWSGQQAAGAPDTLTCGDHGTAWAAAESNSRESITLYYYDQPLIPTEINIVQSYNPSQVVLVELLDPYGEYSDAIIYEAEPEATNQCPYTLSIPVMGIDHLVMGVRITIDQSVLGLGWNEIDAVEMVGYPETGIALQPGDPGMPEGVWDNVYTLPIFPSAELVNYPDEMTLLYSVSSNTRQEVLGFVLDNLNGLGWLLDVDENGNCLDENHCTSKLAGLDYGSTDNELWYFIHPNSPDASLMLALVESNGVVMVTMSLY